MILGIIVVLMGGGWLYLRVSCGDIPDRLEAMRIPRYPDAQFWRITDSTNQCFLSAGTPSAKIHFYSDQKPTEVLSYFKEELPKSGWEFKSTGGVVEGYNGDPIPNDLWASFVKQDGNERTNFYLSARFERPPPGVDWNYSISITGRHSYHKNKR